MGSETGSQFAQEKHRKLVWYERPIPIRRAWSFLKRVSSRSTVCMLVFLLLSIWFSIWSFHHITRLRWLVSNGYQEIGFIAGYFYANELRFIGGDEAYELYRSQDRSWLNPSPRHDRLHIEELPTPVSIRRRTILVQRANVPLRVYHNNCDHADGFACILDGTSLRDRSVSIPIMLLIHLILIALLIIFARRNYRRSRPGCCRRCGYSMIGNESGVCPECGSKKRANPVDLAAVPSA